MAVSENPRLTEAGVRGELQRQPHILMRLAENALTVAESLRDNYFQNTARFVTALRRSIYLADQGRSSARILTAATVADASWNKHRGEVVTFIDGGIGSVEFSSQIPILLRVGSYQVRTGETRLREREQFGYYPVILVILRVVARSERTLRILFGLRRNCWEGCQLWNGQRTSEY